MEAPDIPRSRDGTSRQKFGSTLTSFIKQYPHQSNGKRELRMENKPNERPGTAASGRERPKPGSVDTAIRIGSDDSSSSPNPHSSSSEALNEPLVEDFQDRYTSQPAYGQAESTGYHARAPSKSRSERPPHSPDFSDFEDGGTMSEYSRRGMHVPTRTTSNTNAPGQSISRPPSRSRRPTASRKHSVSGPDTSTPTTPEATPARGYGPGDRSSAESIFSQETSATSVHTLPPLQTKGPDNSDAQMLEPVLEDDPRSFDLVAPAQNNQHVGIYAMERRSEQLFSSEHLQVIFDDPKLLLKFTGFLNSHRQRSIPILIYYLDALKALRAISYANAIAEALDPIKGHNFTDHVARPTANTMLEEKANQAFDVLVREDLPAYIAHTWIQVVSVSIQRRVTGTLAPHLREASEGLAEVFCLTDPSRTDNPIVFASEEFARTTQYGMSYTIGRNCRFLQGPRTNPNSVRRLAEACQAGKEHTEVFVNYRRDGSPFMNLLMIAPLMDSRGNTRYFIGAQVDVSGLIKDCSDLDGLARLVEKEQDPEMAAQEEEANKKDEFQELSEMFNGTELETVRKYGGRMHKEYVDDSSDAESLSHGRPRLLLKDPSQDALDRQRDSMASSIGSSRTTRDREKLNGKLEGVYQHYLLVRPAPSLRILFTSPSLRVPGILQSPFLNRIGGSSRVRSDLAVALGEGRGVTAKIRWLTKADEEGEGEGRPRWIHCTPLLGHSGAVGVWMIVLVDEEGQIGQGDYNRTGRRFRPAPPVASNIGGKEWDATLAQQSRSRDRERSRQPNANAYSKENERRPGGPAGHAGPGRSERDYFPSSERTSEPYRPAASRTTSTYSRHHVASQVQPQQQHKRLPSAGGQSVDPSEFSFNIKTPSVAPTDERGRSGKDPRSEDPRKGMVY